MPIIQISSNAILAQTAREQLLLAVAQLVGDVTGKPPYDVMVFWGQADFVMNGTLAPAVFVDCRSLPGLRHGESMARLSDGLLTIFQQFFPVSAERVFLHLIEAEAQCAWRFRNGLAVCAPV